MNLQLFREIQVLAGGLDENLVFPSNSISTSRYTIPTFIPMNLFEQFHRSANIWFLVVSILQLLPLGLSPLSSWGTISPLSLILLMSMLKDAYNAIKRGKSDKEINQRRSLTIEDFSSDFSEVTWERIRVGNILKLSQDEQVPADIVLLSTEDGAEVAYVETSNLDGENNFKQKNVLKDTAMAFAGNSRNFRENLKKLQEAVLKIEQPNSSLYQFSGSLKLKEFPHACLISIDNLILRGSTLKNTKNVYGIVVYTGPDTKLMQNSQIYKTFKSSRVELWISKYLQSILTELILLALASFALSLYYFYTNPLLNLLFSQDLSGTYQNSITFLILYNNLVPISLYVTLDIIKIVQAKFIEWDLQLFSERASLVKNTDLNEELGQVEYIFADKTGTLTENVMEFKMCWVNGKTYGKTDVRRRTFVNPHPRFNFEDQELINDQEIPEVHDFLMAMGLCHTVKCDKQGEYQAMSPDEEALVIAAKCLGYTFNANRFGCFELSTRNNEYEYSEIGVNHFTSERKRMSLVLEFFDSQYPPVLLCKGADSEIIPRLRLGGDAKKVKKLKNTVLKFARNGLRTLVYSRKLLSEEELRDYKAKYKAASNSMNDRKVVLEKLAEEFERDMEFLGVAGIEDKVQEGVVEAIQSLKQAGIKLWMLTGDKKETTESIGYSASFLGQETRLIEISEKSSEEVCRDLMLNILRYLYPSYCYEAEASSVQELEELLEQVQRNKALTDCEHELALILSGVSLAWVFQRAESMKYFSMLAVNCTSLICYRVSPFQKSQLVKLVRNNFAFKPVVLAIGDGSNDIYMIQEANLGIGIMGKEGMQAANSSDYAVGKFSHLVPLLLVHGRWNYSRTTRVILISFFKNFLLVFPMFYFTFFDYYSGTCLYDAWLIVTYNIFMTSLPVLVLGCTDKDIEREEAIKNPELYSAGVFSQLLNWKLFMLWSAFAVIASLLIFFATVYGSLDLGIQGFTEAYTVTGTLAFMCAVFTALGVTAVIMHEWSLRFIVSMLVSVVLLLLLVYLYDLTGFPTSEITGVVGIVFQSPNLLLILAGVPCANVIIMLSFKYSLEFFKKRPRKAKISPEEIFSARSSLYRFSTLGRRLKSYSNRLSEIFSYKKLEDIMIRENSQIQDEFRSSKYTLKFLNPVLEHTYSEFRNDRAVKYVQRMLSLVFLGILIWNVYEGVSGRNSSLFAVRLVLLASTFIALLIVLTKFFRRYYKRCALLLIISGLVVKTTLEFIYDLDGSMSTAAACMIVFIIFQINVFEVVIIWTIFLFIYLIRIYSLYNNTLSEDSVYVISINYSTLLIGITIISSYVGFAIENSNRLRYIMMKREDAKFKSGNNILSRLLPDFLKEIIFKKQTYFSKDHVTIMFCEICNFDQICAHYSPQELIEMLNKYTLILDNLCDRHGVTKIETVNKTYVACCGIKDFENKLDGKLKEDNHASRVVKLAMEILRRFSSIYLPEVGEKFSVKIGINSGEIVSGVVGEYKPQFSLVGDTINISSRMCSTITKPDMIRISATTYDLVYSKSWKFDESFINFKGRVGPVKTYFVSSGRVDSPRKGSGFDEIKVEDLIYCKDNGSDDHKSIEKIATEKVDGHLVRRPTIFAIEDIKTDELILTDGNEYFIEQKSNYMKLAEEMQWYVLTYMEYPCQRLFRINFIKRNLKNIKLGLYMTCCINSFIMTNYILEYYFLTIFEQNSGELVCIFLRVLNIIVTIFLTSNLEKLYQYRSYQWIMVANYSFLNILCVFSYQYKLNLNYIVVLESMYTNVAVNHISGLLFGYILAVSLIDLTIWLLMAQAQHISFFDEIFFIVFFLTINAIASFSREYYQRETYNLKIKVKTAIRRTGKLLEQMIPDHVYNKLVRGIPILDSLEDITILYADICGFTSYSETKEPVQIVKLLSKLFPKFEKRCIKNNCYKVHTIGDCYVALGLKDFDKANHIEKTENVIRLALSMAKCIKGMRMQANLQMRIGIHTGNIIAGIVGTKVVRYDIYGPDNDIANKAESAGSPGKINITEITKAILEDRVPGKYNFQPNKYITHMPTERQLMTYFLTERSD